MSDEEKITIKEQTEFDNFCNQFKTREIIYAEAIFNYRGDNEWLIYSLEHNVLKRYLVVFPYNAPFYNINYIIRNSKSELFLVDDVFMPTEHWLKPDLNSEVFICEIDKKEHKIKPSSDKIFWQTVISLYYRKFYFFDKSFTLQPLTDLCFDRYVSRITAESWENAILAQKFNDRLQFNSGFNEADESTLGVYRAKDAYARIGEEKLRRLIIKHLPIKQSFYDDAIKSEFNLTPGLIKTVEDSVKNLLSTIAQEAGEDLANKYTHYSIKETDDADSVIDFFKEPRVINFTKEADEKIRRQILDGKLNDTFAEYYLRNQLLLADRKPVAELFEVICHILKTTEKDSLFYAAGSALNEIWTYLPKKIEDDLPFTNIIYNLYWPRVKSLRQINKAINEDWGRWDESDEPEKNIFIDAMTWILCIDNDKLTDINPELGEYLKSLAGLPDNKIKELPWWISSRILGLKNNKLLLKEQFVNVLSEFPPEQAGNNLGWCDSKEEAKIVLNSLLGQPTKKYRIKAKEACLEKLLMRRNTFDTKGYILQRLIDDFDKFTKKFKEERLSFFTAACEGVADERELPLIKRLSKLFINLDDDEKTRGTIDEALKIAKRNIEIVKLQRNATLDKKFLEKARKMTKIEPVKHDLDRFIMIQESSHRRVLEELSAGRKYGHYMWYTFPQLKGLGSSNNAKYYGIEDLDEAKAYLNNATLRQNLLELCGVVANLEVDDISQVFPFPDNLKLRSSMTLFSIASPDEKVFRKIIDKFYDGILDEKTIELIAPKILTSMTGGKDEHLS